MRSLLLAMLITSLGCSSAQEMRSPPPIGICSTTRAEEEAWSTLLSQTPKFTHRLDQASDPEELLQREIVLRKLLLSRYGALCPPEERTELRRDADDAAVGRTYMRKVLEAGVHLGREEARKIFDEHPGAWNHPPSVAALEIFLWAPEDLPKLRAEKKKLIETLHEKCTTVEAFREAAKQSSEATSAFRGGFVGTIEEPQVSGAIHDTLFSGKKGLSDPVENSQGLYLFFITRINAGSEKSFDEVEEKILSRLRRMQLTQLIQEHQAGLRTRYEVPEEAESGGIVLVIGKENFTTEDLELIRPHRHQIRARAMKILEERELKEREIEVEAPDALQVDFEISQRIFDRLLKQKLKEASPSEDNRKGIDLPSSSAREIERWSFDLLRVEKADKPKILYLLYRALYDGKDSLESVASRLREHDNLELKIQPYREVLPEEVAGLGPEIHSTLKQLLPGETSHPLHPAQTHDLVVCRMLGKHPDTQATAEARQRASHSRRRREIKKALREDLIEECHALLFD